jgi:hypothetical protein
MSVTSSRTIQLSFSGDITEQIIQSALDNTVSPAKTDIVSLVSGDNTITAPVVSGLVVTGLMIIPPAGNVNLITLKGVTGDTGVPLHLTDPTSLALNTTFVSLVINAAAAIVGVRLIWS